MSDWDDGADGWGAPASAMHRAPVQTQSSSDDWGDNNTSGWGASSSAARAPQPPRSRGCFNCGEEGHSKADCPKPQKPRGCFNCGEEGHSKADCPQPQKPRGCFTCGEEGHSKASCPQAGQGDGSRRTGCFKCGKEGHSKADCPEPDQCRNCGAEGHLSNECQEPAKTYVVKNKEGNDVEVYVPSEVQEDQLFEQGINCGINFDKFYRIPLSVSGENPPNFMELFETSGLRPLLLDNVKKSHYLKPTPIQKVAIPAAMLKRDLMACAQTGSGKTAAFILPILHTLLECNAYAEFGSCQTPQALIIAPTRELAIQIKDEARKFAFGSSLKSVVVYGGTSTAFQSNSLAQGCNVLIGTPGRIKDFMERGKLNFTMIQFLVLDEADRLLDMGFSEVIREIVRSAGMPAKGNRTTLMFSATFPTEVQRLAREFLDNYLFVHIGQVGAANKDVEQTFHEVTKFEKREKLVDILRDVGAEKTMVFVETKKNCDFIAAHLCSEGFPATSIHGDRLQREREMALADFKSGRMSIIVATNVAARGLDIRGVKHVVNFDLLQLANKLKHQDCLNLFQPDSIDEYVHRIGRTGRVGNLGKATSFFDPSYDKNTMLAPALVRILTEAEVEVPDFLQQFGSSFGGAVSASGDVDIRGGAVPVVEEEW